jgi:uncharacterized phage protein (TIGR02220 family)
MITIIDHSVRAKLNLSPIAYMVCHACSMHQPLMKGTGVIYLSELLGLSSGTITQSMKTLIEMGLLEKKENGYYYPSTKWYIANDGEDVVVTTVNDDMAKVVIEYFNEVNDTKYQLHSNVEIVKKILKVNPKLTLDHFKSVIIHKKETWGSDEKMKDYNRPSTLFSSKFLKYLDDANHYWINKQKHDSTTTIAGY